ncbi:MAG: thiamine phosphate synthase [Clostridia bacterium]|nr:thiamine phosphate synthase [Clostridia bacterium]
MKCDKKNMLLYAVTDRMWTGKKTLYEQIEDALKGGITCLQLREKNLDDEKFLEEALKIKSLCNSYNVPLIINDNVDIALKSGADGVHVGQHDMQAENVRKLVGENMIIGVSARTVEQAVLAEKNGADYLGVGAVFNTSTKIDASSVSFRTVSEICKAVSIPVVAIGGISSENILQLSGLGVDGVALVSSIFSAENIEQECKKLRSLSEKMVNG